MTSISLVCGQSQCNECLSPLGPSSESCECPLTKIAIESDDGTILYCCGGSIRTKNTGWLVILQIVSKIIGAIKEINDQYSKSATEYLTTLAV